MFFESFQLSLEASSYRLKLISVRVLSLDPRIVEPAPCAFSFSFLVHQSKGAPRVSERTQAAQLGLSPVPPAGATGARASPCPTPLPPSSPNPPPGSGELIVSAGGPGMPCADVGLLVASGGDDNAMSLLLLRLGDAGPSSPPPFRCRVSPAPLVATANDRDSLRHPL